MIRRVVLLATAALALLAAPATGQAPAGSGPQVLATRVEGPITPVVAAHLSDAVAAAEAGGYEALLVTLDTPGGLDTSMRAIVQDFFTADVPVVVYVSPPGARAASAGAIMAFAAHVAAMAPGTNIGAATPIDLQGGDLGDKIINDATAYVEAIAEERDRDVDFAVETVTDGRSAPASEAVELGAVDLVAEDVPALLAEIDGRTVTLHGGEEVTLRTDDAEVVPYDVSSVRRLLQRLADPNIAFLLISIGTLALVYELANPGGIIAGTLGAIMLVLGFFSVAVLPVNVAGVLLAVLAAVLFVAELFVPGVGVFAGGGTLALLAAGLFLFEGGVTVDLAVLLPIPIVVGVLVVLAGRMAWRARQAPAYIGPAGNLVGAEGVVRDRGTVFVEGARWQARSSSPLSAGDRVRVVAQDGLVLEVEPAS